MSKPILTAALLTLALLPPAASAAAPDFRRVLKDADSFRLDPGDIAVESEVVVSKNGEVEKTRRYLVHLRPQRQSLVLMRSPAEKGQKVLMLGDDFWLIMPTSQRPMRVTPTQKLIGDAATGDIATLSWSDDYDGELAGEVPCGQGGRGICLKLALQAARKGSTYARIELLVLKDSHQPVSADLFVASDKLAKQAEFVAAPMPGSSRPMIAAMRLSDRLTTGKLTEIRYLSRTPKKVPDDWFNPMFLTRAATLD